MLRRLLLAAAVVVMLPSLFAQTDAALFSGLRWRSIGPFRGGRTVAAVGVPSQPGVFYMGVNNGGVWKTNDYGRIWRPIFDDQPTGSIGAIAIAPSNPNIVYVGSGEGLQRPDLSTGDGIYKSTDAGRTWTHLGLRDAQQIGMIAIDPRDPNRLFVAAMGHPYGPNPERGIFRSTDGGATFEKVLYRGDTVCGMDVAIDPADARTVYAAMWEAQNGPWENAYFNGPGNGVFKSSDGGTTWKQLTNGLPSGEKLGRAGIEVAPANPRRLFVVAGVDRASGGLFRSDDAGESWKRVNTDERLWGRPGDFNEVRTDPKNADVVYVANIVMWKSSDGGKTFASFRGAPGGDDYHRIWIDPSNTRIMLLGVDQGACVTVNGGESWSSWYNQPTSQMFHVSTDNAFPYRVCGGQQESGSACVDSRSDDGAITFRNWHPVGAEEYGYAVPDPLDPDLIYGGKISRHDRRTGQTVDISPKPLRAQGYRVIRTQPIVFSPVDPHILYFASNTMWKTSDGGQSWTQISPDLTRASWAVPSSAGKYIGTKAATPTQRGVIYAIAPSPLDINTIWAGTDDGLIHLTSDGGKSWTDVTPPQVVPWAKVSVLEASHSDANSAWAAINTFRLDDLRPHILRTRDRGKSWSEIVSGIPEGAPVNVVREDPVRKGLLFAGTERQVYVSFDDGDHWQSLRINMPATSIRDLVIKDNDVVVATHGRGFWILDDIARLRQMPLAATSGSAKAFLFTPSPAIRIRWSQWPDTPLPPDEPMGQNPPDGAVIDYWLPSKAAGPVVLEISDAAGTIVRRYSSADPVPSPNTTMAVNPYTAGPSPTVTEPATVPSDYNNIPWYWIRPLQRLSEESGAHRFVWDLHYTPRADKPSYPISAVPRDTARDATSPWVMPGTYTVKLSAGGQTTTAPLIVKMDPRVKTPNAGLQQQFDLSMQMYRDLVEVDTALEQARAMRKKSEASKSRAAAESKKSAKAEEPRFEGALARLAGESDEEEEEAPRPRRSNDTLTGVASSLRTMLEVLQAADVGPTTQAVAAVAETHAAAQRVLEEWRKLKK